MRHRYSTAVRSFMPHHAAITRTALSRSPKSAASCTPLYGSGGGKISGLFRSGGQEMAKNGHIVRYTAKELAEQRRRGETRSDGARADTEPSERLQEQRAPDRDASD